MITSIIFFSYYFIDFSSSATVVYKTQQAALHARQKLHGFEYPIGESKLDIKFQHINACLIGNFITMN